MVDVDSRREVFESFSKSQQGWGLSDCCVFVCNEQVRRSDLSRRKLELEEVRNFGSTSNRKQAYFAKSGFLLHFGDSPHLSVTSAGMVGMFLRRGNDWCWWRRIFKVIVSRNNVVEELDCYALVHKEQTQAQRADFRWPSPSIPPRRKLNIET